MNETVAREGLGAPDAGEGDGGDERMAERIAVKPREVAEKELRIARGNEELWSRAVSFVRGLLRKSHIAWLRRVIAGNPKGWYTEYHLGSGMNLRNRLRDNGFGEFDFEIGNLDNVYVEILEEATRDPAELE